MTTRTFADNTRRPIIDTVTIGLWQLLDGLSGWRVMRYHVTVGTQGMLRVAITGFTAPIRAKIPMVGGALVAVVPLDVASARAGSRLPVTVAQAVTAVLRTCARGHTRAACSKPHTHENVVC